MKNSNAKTYKNTKIKLAIVVTTLAMGLFSFASNSEIVQASELIKAETIESISLYQEAKESLALSFNSLSINQSYNDKGIKNVVVTQRNSANKNIPVTLSKTNLISE